MTFQMNNRHARGARRPQSAGLVACAAVLALSACATPKPFDTGQVRPGFVACGDYADIDRAETGALPEGCIDAGGRDYEVVVSAERYTLVDLTAPTDEAPVRAYILRRAL